MRRVLIVVCALVAFGIFVGSASAATLIGDSSVEATQNQMASGWAMAYPFTATSSGLTSSVSLYFNGSNLSTTTQVGVYTDASGSPGTLLGMGTISNGGQSKWGTGTLSGVNLTSGTTYFLALLSTAGQLYYNDVYPGTCSISPQLESSTSLTTLPSTWTTGSTWNACPASVYVSGTPIPSNTAAPTISGTPQQGQTLTGSLGSWTGGPTSYAYQWYQCNSAGAECEPIAGATHRTYTVAASDIMTTLQVAVSATNAAGTSSPATSAPTALAYGSYTCTKYASPSGSDSNSGSASSPLGDMAALENALAPGQIGCLDAGTYGNTSSATQNELGASGTAGNPITIEPTPGATPRVIGLYQLTGSYITLQYLNIDGSNTQYTLDYNNTVMQTSTPLEIIGSNDILQYDDFYQSVGDQRGNGIEVTNFGASPAPANDIIRFNDLHTVGNTVTTTGDDSTLQHIIYDAQGTSTQIYDNWMWSDPDGFCIQFYPTTYNDSAYGNVCDSTGNGVVFGSASGVSGTASNNAVNDNVFINLTGFFGYDKLQQAANTSWGGTVGSGNTFETNDVFNPGNIGTGTGVTIANNITSNPLFVNSSANDYQLQSGSPVSGYGLWDGLGAAPPVAGAG